MKENILQEYYLGSVLFYKNEKNYEVIDGQQRLTTFLLLDNVCHSNESVIVENKEQLKFYFNSPISKNNIFLNKKYLKEKQLDWLQNNWEKVKKQLVVSVIITNNQDDAFTFFETQNNRGKKLSAVDYLKSYHLRELNGNEKQQRYFATRWDKNNSKQFLNTLYSRILWRARNWKGNNVYYGNQKGILNEFQKKLTKMNADKIKIYPNVKNVLAHNISFSKTNGIKLLPAPISLEANPIDYPFAIRQPLEKGIAFFLYTEKFNELYRYLFYSNTENEFNKEFKHFYKLVYLDTNMSYYFVEFFRLICVAYYDKFEKNKFLVFIQYLDYLIGSKRLSMSSVVAQTPVKILRDEKQNLLDVISNSFEPVEIFEFIKSITNNDLYDENIIIDHKVKGRYKKGLLKYYNKKENESLKNRLDWIK